MGPLMGELRTSNPWSVAAALAPRVEHISSTEFPGGGHLIAGCEAGPQFAFLLLPPCDLCCCSSARRYTLRCIKFFWGLFGLLLERLVMCWSDFHDLHGRKKN